MGRTEMADNVADGLAGLSIDSKEKLSGLKKKHEKKEKEKNAGPSKKIGELKPPPSFIADRLAMWDRLKTEQDARIAAEVPKPLTVTLPDGKTVAGETWRTSPYDIALGISKGLADNCVVAKVNGEVWDLDRPLEGDAKLELVKFEDEEGQAVFWHSSAHVLGEAMERCYAGHLCYGPPIDQGFYYDMWSEDYKVSDNDFKAIDDVVKGIVKEKQPFERLEMKKADLLEMFKYNEFKLRILNERVKTETTTVYRCGPLIDLCRGPHVRHTGKIKSMSMTKSSATYWEGNSEAESLQRIYGISFPDNCVVAKVNGEVWDLDRPLEGDVKLELIKEEYWKRGFQEVISPNIYNAKLWQTSGHWDHYAENMFKISIE